jgi:ABC-type transport system involved in multi-copper enzyme maturation permease subunit
MSLVETMMDHLAATPTGTIARRGLKSAYLLAGQEILRLWRSPSLYLMLSALLLLGDLLVRSHRNLILSNDVLIVSQPLSAFMWVSVAACCLYIALVGATSVAAEREDGVLEVLMYAPIEPAALVWGYFGAYATTGAILVTASAGATAATSMGLGLQPGATFWWTLLPAVISISEAGAIGLLLSCSSRQMRTAVFLLLGLVLALAGIRAAGGAFVPAAAQPDSWAYYIGLLLAGPSRAIRAVSPLDSYAAAAEAAWAGQYGIFAGWLVLGPIRTALWMFMAIRAFVRVGARP